MGRGEVSSHRHAHKEADQGHSIIFKHNLTFLGQQEQEQCILGSNKLEKSLMSAWKI